MLLTRVITALVIIPVALAGVFLLPQFQFSLFVGAVLIVAAWEWGNLGGLNGVFRLVYAFIVAFTLILAGFLPAEPVMFIGLLWWAFALVFVVRFPAMDVIWSSQTAVLLIGILALVPGWVALKELKLYADSSYLICFLFFLIWGADIGAYFAGRAFGRVKLAVNVSPGKTWEGFYGGLVVVIAVAAGMSAWFGKPELKSADGLELLAFSLVIGMVSVLGDLTISMFKRKRNIKDSSNLLPGHGGILDRIDSLLPATPVFVMYLLSVTWL